MPSNLNAKFPLISVITVSYNQGKYIKQTIDSVLAQEYPNFEHIIVDGGSTDETVSILKQYPHLKWTSQKDNGQSDALTQGFNRAEGEIICWLNSDDWLAPGAFHAVVPELKNAKIVLGRATETDEVGNPKQEIKNTARTFYDMLRYWIPYAWLAQVSVFFRREFIEEVKRADGTFLDKSLYFCMDYDLWMRFAQKTSFTKCINQNLSFYRMSDQNKTGAHALMAQKENSRVFRRYLDCDIVREHELSFIIPANACSAELKVTLENLLKQTALDFEIVIVDYSGDRAVGKAIQDLAWTLWESQSYVPFRFEKCAGKNILDALNCGIDESRGSIVSFLNPGDIPTQNFVEFSLKTFAIDWVGMLMPRLEGVSDMPSQMCSQGSPYITLDGVLQSQHFFPHFVARRIALKEIAGFSETNEPVFSAKEMYARLLLKGWHVLAAEDLRIKPGKIDLSKENADLKAQKELVSTRIIVSIANEYESDPFLRFKAENGQAPQFSAELFEKARAVLPPELIPKKTVRKIVNQSSVLSNDSSKPTFLFVHTDHPIDPLGSNGGAEMATIYQARNIAKLGFKVIVGAILPNGNKIDQGVEFQDLTLNYDVEKLLKKVAQQGEFALYSTGKSLPLVLSKDIKQCKFRGLISHVGSIGDIGLRPEVFANHVDKIVCVSKAHQQKLISEGISNSLTTVVSHGVDRAIFSATPSEMHNPMNLVFSGAIVPDKGVHLLLEAFMILKSNFPELTLDIFGSAAMWSRQEYLNLEDYQTKIPGLRYHGKVSPTRMAQAFQGAGLCIAPSIWFETFGLGSVEAQSCGCPVVAFNVGGLAEGIIPSETGVIVPEISSTALVTAIAQLLSDPAKLKYMSQRCAQLTEERFSWQRSAKALVEAALPN
ncbi:MAG: glycosyltransferase [bacterium]|nr:glycosyltransferase [bacterium]